MPNFEEAVISFEEGSTQTHMHISPPPPHTRSVTGLIDRQTGKPQGILRLLRCVLQPHRYSSGFTAFASHLHSGPTGKKISIREGERGGGGIGGGRRMALIFNKII